MPAKTAAPKTFAGRVGAEIRRQRERRKLTVPEAARRAGVPVPTWYHFEKGRFQLERLPAIARALGCRPSALIPDK